MGRFSLKIPHAWKLNITIIIYYNFIKEPWITPDRATPKSCYPFRKKTKIKTNNYLKKQPKKNTIHTFQNKLKKTHKKQQRKNEKT